MALIDSHVYAFRSNWVAASPRVIQQARLSARKWLGPLSSALHGAQTYARYLPDAPRRAFEQLGLIAPLPGLLVESTYQDLKAAMKESGTDKAVVVAHPPLISNELVLELASEDPSLLAVVNLPPGTRRPGEALKRAVKRGARGIKIHPAADGEGPDSPRFAQLIQTATELGLPVFLHTGRFQIPFVLKSPELGDAQTFEPWFRDFPQTRFVLTHMNYSQPHIALDLAEQYPNLWVEISWQPSELIGEAVGRIGAERVLYGTDWPLLGNNMSVGVRRVRAAVDSGMISRADSELVLGGSAAKLLGL